MAAPKATAHLPERYKMVRHLADGGMASVFEARDTLLDRPVAVKLLSDALSADDAARRRFTREARAAARLSSNPHVVTVFDAGEHDGAAFLVMAFYPGGSVGARLRRREVAPDTALRWIAEAAGALDHAHGHGVVHRDVKPDNLLLDAAERVAVGDFGIATAAWESSLTQTGLVLGTMAYLSPEQRAGSPATPASDRYALAVVAQELLTGVRRGATEPGRPLGPRLTAALAAGAADDPAARPPSAAALAYELEEAFDAEGIGAATAATRPVATPRPRPRAAAPPPAPTPVPVPVPVPREEATVARAPRGPAGPPPGDHGRVPEAPEPRRRRTGAVVAGVLALAVLGGAGAVLAAGGDDSDGRRADAATTSTTRTARTTRTTTQAAPATTTTQAPAVAPAPATEAEAPAEPTTTATTPATSEAPASSAGLSRRALADLNDRGFSLINQGDPASAVAPLQTAVEGLCTDESDITCAFALFNLGQALRQSGRPAEAIPFLERRLAVSDYKVATVRAELARARAAAG